MEILKIKNLYKNYSNSKIRVEVLKNINFTLMENEFVGIMGASGCGKTTLLNVASGIDRCDKGDILIDSENICKMKKNDLALFRRKNMGMVFQDFNLINSLTVKENIMVPLVLDKKYDDMADNNIEKFADMFDIKEVLERYPYEISGGQQQRTAICRAIINNPKIIFADEPTGNLDSKVSEKVLTYFEKIHRECISSILMVTHDPFSASFCDRVVFLRDGLIIREIKSNGDKEKFLKDIITNFQEISEDKKSRKDRE